MKRMFGLSLLGAVAALGVFMWLGQPATTAAVVTFTKDVAPIIQKNCQTCHRPGEVAPMSFLTYKEVRPWARSIREVVASRQMPPWFADPQHGEFSNDVRLSQKEIDTITAWVEGGAAVSPGSLADGIAEEPGLSPFREIRQVEAVGIDEDDPADLPSRFPRAAAKEPGRPAVTFGLGGNDLDIHGGILSDCRPIDKKSKSMPIMRT